MEEADTPSPSLDCCPRAFPRCHGLLVETPASGILRFGIDFLVGLGETSGFAWRLRDEIPEAYKRSIGRFGTPAFRQCSAKFRDTIFKMNKAILNLSECVETIEYGEGSIDGSTLSNHGLSQNRAIDDLPYHLDSLISYLRILADCLAFALPYFYRTEDRMKNRSFRDHREWFFKHPDFDPSYTSTLRRRTTWFDKLAGKDPKGIRDLAVHNMATYQISYSCHGPRREIIVQQVTSQGIQRREILFTLSNLLAEFFAYLDETYEFHARMLTEEFAPYFNFDYTAKSNLVRFVNFNNIESKFRFYPRIQEVP